MKLIKQPTIFVVKTKYDCEGYKENRKYYFAKIEDVMNFLNGEFVFDIHGDRQYQGSYELVTKIYEKNEYELDWELDKEDDEYMWTIKENNCVE